MNNTYSLYESATGLFTGKSITGGKDALLLDALKLHPECSFVIGEYDRLSQKVDLQSGRVVDYQPPKPGERYAWNAEKKRWLYEPTAAEALASAKARALKRVNDLFAARLAAVRADYPLDEVTSWSKQETEARALLANRSAATPLLSAISGARGVELFALAQKIIAKADQLATVTGALIGKRQKYEDEITAATTPAEADAIAERVLTE